MPEILSYNKMLHLLIVKKNLLKITTYVVQTDGLTCHNIYNLSDF